MIRGLYIAASTAMAENKRIDVIANNIANLNTAGYKKDTMVTESFPEVLLSRIGGPFGKDSLSNAKSGGINMESSNGLYSLSTKSGFFNVQTANGISKNSSIRFKIDDQGYMVTPQGNYILGANGPIKTQGGDISVDNRGQVISGGTVVDRLKVSTALNIVGNMSYSVNVAELATSFEQGQLNSTGNSFDMAIQGKGFFTIETPNGIRYTRNGEFTKSADGFLVTKEGYKVQGQNGSIIVDGKDITINEKGEISTGSEKIDALKLVDFSDYKALAKEGDCLYKLNGSEADLSQQFAGAVQQGFVESSNVNSVKEMVNMITIMRSYEANQKIVKINDELLGKSVSEIGRV